MIALRASYDLPDGKVKIAADAASYDACGSC
jgi:hypothetical protein